jgi:hypothetical protein
MATRIIGKWFDRKCGNSTLSRRAAAFNISKLASIGQECPITGQSSTLRWPFLSA